MQAYTYPTKNIENFILSSIRYFRKLTISINILLQLLYKID
jgi:hypothetical protein